MKQEPAKLPLLYRLQKNPLFCIIGTAAVGLVATALLGVAWLAISLVFGIR